MPKKVAPKTAVEVARLAAPGMHAVGGVAGLHLSVKETGARSWVLRVKAGSKRRDIGLGGYPDVTLAQAREKAREAREMIAQGVDPIADKKARRSALLAAQGASVTFADAAGQYIKAHAAGWRNVKHAGQWQSTLETYAFPVIGGMHVADIATAHVMRVLEPIWSTKTETASRLRGRIESILDWSRVRGYRDGENPARWKGHLDKLLAAKNKVAKGENHPALDWREVGAFWSALAGAEGIGAAALRFAILTAARSGEVRGATWAEVDLQAKVWTVPASRMKAGREHRVPLSDAAIELLTGLPRMADTDLVFPSSRSGELSDATLGAVIRRAHDAAVKAGGAGWIDRRQGDRIATAHGIARSTFRTWAAEATGYPREIAEAALGHVVGDAVERAYQRGDAIDRRRRLMAEWAHFLSMPSATAASVTPIRGAA